MSIDAQNFRSWFVDVLASLYKQHNAGFAVAMIAFPILERYVRQKVGLAPEYDLSDRFFDELATIFHELPDRIKAKQFWNVYRNGLLHQVTFSRITRRGNTLPAGALSHDVSRIVIDKNGDFFLNPIAFANRVIEIVEADFSTFEGATGSSALSLPQVYYLPWAGGAASGVAAVSGAAFHVTGYVLGTATPPRQQP